MQLTAISRFSWKGRVYEPGDSFDCPDEIVGNRMISDKLAQGFVTELPPAPEYAESAAQEQSEPIAETPKEAEISEDAPVVKKVKKKTASKKKKV